MFGLLTLVFITKVDFSKTNTASYITSIDNREILLQSYILYLLCNSALTVVCNGIKEEIIKGTFSQKMMSIVPMQWLIWGKIIGSIAITLLEILVILLFSKIFFLTTVAMNFQYIIICILAFLGMFGFSLCIGALTLEKKKIGQLLFIIQTVLLVLISGVFISPRIFIFSKIIPLSYANEIFNSLDSFLYLEILTLGIISIIWLLFGIFLFSISFKRIKKKGKLFY